MPSFSSALNPTTNGLALGTGSLRWSGFFSNIDISGAFTISSRLGVKNLEDIYFADQFTGTVTQQIDAALAAAQAFGGLVVAPSSMSAGSPTSILANTYLLDLRGNTFKIYNNASVTTPVINITSNALVINPLTTSVAAASTGTIRLGYADTIVRRNKNLFGNTTLFTNDGTTNDLVIGTNVQVQAGLTIAGGFSGAAFVTTTGQITTSVASGTPPFIITSTDVVPNLNVATLNGVTVSGAPTAGQALVATGVTTAAWTSNAGTYKMENIQYTPVTFVSSAGGAFFTFNLPANELAVGQALRFTMSGLWTNTSVATRNYTFTLKAGATTLWTWTLATSSASVTNGHWSFEALAMCTAAGSAGTIEVQAITPVSNLTGMTDPTTVSNTVNAATVAFDTTVIESLTFNVAQTNDATTATTGRQWMVERLAEYRVLKDPSLPYDNYSSFTDTNPHYISGSKNLLTSARGQVDLRPGFDVLLEATGAKFTGTVRRIFQWKRWDGSSSGLVGTYIWMCCEVNASANTSKVYGYRIGVDSSFQLLWTCSTSSECFDFVAFNNHVGFGNDTDMKKWDGSTVTKWGIAAPLAAATVDVASTVGTLTTYSMNGFDYVYTYYNSLTGHESSPSALSSCTGIFTLKFPQVSVVASSDPQVTNIILYRTTDGGSTSTSDMRMVGAATTTYANVNQVISDTVTDINLGDRNAPAELRNDPPAAGMGFAMNPSGRIFYFSDNTLYYTGREEIQNGVREECVPGGLDGNNESYQHEITGVASTGNGVAVFQSDRIDKVDGDTLDSFLFYNIAKRQGARQRDAIVEFGGICFWLDTANTIWMLGGDEVGQPITTDIQNIDHSQASLKIHLRGNDHWLLLLDGASAVIYAMNFDSRQWMTPWFIQGSANALYSGEIASGDYQLVLGGLQNKVYRGLQTSYTDAGTFYNAVANFSLLPVADEAKPNVRGVVDYVAVQCLGRVPDTVGFVADDDPTQAIDQTTNPEEPDIITQGVYLLNKYYKAGQPLCQRFSPTITWIGDGTGFSWREVFVQVHSPQQVTK